MTNATLSSGPAARAGAPITVRTPRRADSRGTDRGERRSGMATMAMASTAAASTAAPAASTPTAATRAASRWSARLLITAGFVMVPWLCYLAATLPSATTAAHWDAVWVGLDTAEAAGLLGTGLLLRHADPRGSLTAAATAALLAVDAWFDCGTAATGGDRLVSLAMAIGLELPLAAALAVFAWRAFPRTASAGR